ncbi:protein tyrosine phosphatase family protein [Marinimicrococcus flavescens]|uniref:Protein tyrosine phosphatase family protein n=1 Tax=Marinimicrococcus flavescens TaxID=3031815 RepID=A0AAP4D6E3_9PROT|nr:protein tyrosine phosphatase family protein [Marinimicrococcus flavescens]
MIEKIAINDRFTVGKAQPSAEAVPQIARDGFRSVVNLRVEGADGQKMSPAEEGEAVRRAGMSYFHLPVKADSLSDGLVDRFREGVAGLPGPVFVHCASGKRAGAFTMMHVAAEQGMSGKEVLAKAAEMGFECDTPQLESFVRDYVDSHRR